AGDPQSPVQLAPEWKGAAPPQAPVRIAARSGVDLNPVDPVAQRERLLAYVWPDQHRRLAQLEAALDLARADPPHVEGADAADWLDARLAVEPETGVCRVVIHSVAYQYFPPDSRRRIRARVEAAGEEARADAPLAWLRFEIVTGEEQFSLGCGPGRVRNGCSPGPTPTAIGSSGSARLSPGAYWVWTSSSVTSHRPSSQATISSAAGWSKAA
ncbi:MAG TPA: DUF2332 family protein, partial [Allosphingosinicella sp.]|nr:DUF2332 family protein [Allosphingosinicella sp.]